MKKECLLDKITEKIQELIFISTPEDPEDFIYISPAYKRLFAIDIEDLQNNSFAYIHINDRDYVKKKFLNLINTGEEYSIEYRIISLDRSVKWMYEIGFPIKEHSDIIYYVRSARNITEQKYTNDRFKNMTKVFMDSADPIFIEDLNGYVIDMNDEAILRYGWTREELLGKPIKNIVPPERHEQADELLAKCREGKAVRNIEGLRWTKDRKIIPVLLTFSLLNDEKSNPVAIATISKDITEVIEFRRLQKEIIKISEFERQNIGHILHDDLGQILTGVSYLTEALKEKIVRKMYIDISDIDIISDQINKAIFQTRVLSRGLNPVHLQEGLALSLEELAKETERLYNITCSVVIEGDNLISDNTIAIHLLYIAKESVHNAIKHGKAKNIEIFFYVHEGNFLLRIQNDGFGIQKNGYSSEGLGLQIMKYRADMIDADFNAEGDDVGFVVTVRKKTFQDNI